MTDFANTTTAPASAPAELNEADLAHATGGLLPAVGPASAKKTPTTTEDDLIGLL